MSSNEELKETVGFLVTLVYGVLALCLLLLITLIWRTSYDMDSICSNNNNEDLEDLAGKNILKVDL